MDIFGIAGWSGSGKTTLITALLPVFTAQGVTVATIKHTHHHPEFGGPEDLALGEAARWKMWWRHLGGWSSCMNMVSIPNQPCRTC